MRRSEGEGDGTAVHAGDAPAIIAHFARQDEHASG